MQTMTSVQQPDPTGRRTWGVTDTLTWEVLERLLSKTKGLLLTKHGAGYLGSLLCHHDYIWDEDCPTAYNTGATIAFNPWFFYALDKEGRITLLAHELWHSGYDHFTRRGDRCPDYWNIAGDYVINNDLQNNNYSFDRLLQLCPKACLDHQYDNMSTEEIYNLLNPTGQMMMPQPVPMPGQPCSSGSPSAGQGTPLDPAQGGMGADVRVGSGTPSKDVMIGNLVRAKQASIIAKEAGVIPGEIEQVIENFLNPVLPWETLLHRFFNEMDQSDYSWKRPNRRYESDYLPCMYSDNGLDHLVYYLDVSGSITDSQALRFFSEVHHIHQDLTPKKLTMITFDTKIRDVYELTEDDPFDKFQIHGRGGTSLVEVQEDIKKRKPTAAIIFSDMYVKAMKEDPGVPILWAVMDNKRAKVPFGQIIHIRKDQIK